MERKLTTILCADVHGYSRLMEADEEATLRTLSAYRNIIDSLIESHRGRFVNAAGDSVLAEFTSVVEAVTCAFEIQDKLKTENAGVPPERRMEFRIGVNLGDVMVEGEQIYGDGVNVASRLESLAEPGGICISHTVHDQIGNKLALGYEDLGEQHVKNIAKPVRVFRVLPNGTVPRIGQTRRIARSHWRGGMLSLTGLAIIMATIVFFQHVSLKPPHTSASIPPAQSPALALPDKPSIAVLPFTNMSGEREQQYFSDGITDDLITDLSRLPGLFVISRELSFTYKGKSAKLEEVGRELGVKYVLGGAVRKAAGQVRITVQLADTTTGAELWDERYDRPMRDVFALQDEIVRSIVTTLNLELSLSQQGLVIPRRTENLEAYDDVLRGTEYLLSYSKTGNVKARQLFEKAIELDPRYGDAYASLSLNYYFGFVLSLNPDPGGLEQALRTAQQALALEDSLASAHGVLGVVYVLKGLDDQALTEAQRAIALDPNYVFAYSGLAQVMNDRTYPSEALAAVETAMRLDPRNRNDVNYLWEQGYAYSLLGQWKKAITALKGYSGLYPEFLWSHVLLAQDYYKLGDHDDASAETAQVERAIAVTPNSAIAYMALANALNNQAKPADALVAAEKGLSLDRRNLLILCQQGWAYTQLGRWGDAISPLKGCRGHPDFWTDVLLSVDYSALGKAEAARSEAAKVERAVALDPNDAFRYVGLATVLNSTGRPAEALVAIGNAMRLDPQNSVYYLVDKGVADTLLGRWQEATSAFKDYSARYPDEIWPHVDLAIDYAEVGQDVAARAEVAEALTLDPQMSLKIATEPVSAMRKERVAADLSTAGLK